MANLATQRHQGLPTQELVNKIKDAASEIKNGNLPSNTEEIWEESVEHFSSSFPEATNPAGESTAQECAECVKELYDAQAEGRENSAQVYSSYIDEVLGEQGEDFRAGYRLLTITRSLYRLAVAKQNGRSVDYDGTDIATVADILLQHCEGIRSAESYLTASLSFDEERNPFRAPFAAEETIDALEFPSKEDY